MTPVSVYDCVTVEQACKRCLTKFGYVVHYSENVLTYQHFQTVRIYKDIRYKLNWVTCFPFYPSVVYSPLLIIVKHQLHVCREDDDKAGPGQQLHCHCSGLEIILLFHPHSRKILGQKEEIQFKMKVSLVQLK